MAFDEDKQKEKVASIERKEAEELTRLLAEKYKVPYLDLSRISIDLDVLKLIPEERARGLGMAVIQSTGKKIQIAVKNPNLDSTKEAIEQLRRDSWVPQIFISSLPGLERVWARYKEIPQEAVTTSNVVDISRANLEEFGKSVTNTIQLREFLDLRNRRAGGRITEILDYILAGAFELEASDVHIEPEEKKIRLRLRLDGILEDIMDFSFDVHKMLLSRIKLVAQMKLNIHNRAQDGRFTIRTRSVDVEVRVSTLPGPYGESIVMRILHPKAIALTFDKLGMQPPIYTMIAKELKKPNGMIITTGPTGSGKTTTLYAFIKKVREEPGIKIITIEDPIEYHIEGITQTQINKEAGYTFENGLSAIVRQDPDVILVGEIRNRETAEIAMHASLTGHLVFSTLHTNSASGTIPRLVDLGVTPNIIAPAINITLAQRLVRVLCVHCKKPAELDPNRKKLVDTALAHLPAAYEKPAEPKIFSPSKCDVCNHTGYKGRIGLFEAFLIDDNVERLILKNPSEAEVKEVAVKQGMITMFQDGILKILAGVTSFEEVERVVGVE